jgi:protein transport protein SEC24
MIIWIGTGVSPDVLHGLFGVHTVNQLNPDTAEQAIGTTGKSIGKRVAAIIAQLRQDRLPQYMSIQVLPHEHPFSGRFFQALVEDRTAGLQMTYTEFLQRIGVSAGGPSGTPPPQAPQPGMMMGAGLLPPSYR